jgi:Fe2+ or Zn2+ uptake regulation protein
LENLRRSTKQLEAVWDAVRGERSHPTADQIYAKVRAVIPNISLATVYRNLQKLVTEGRLQVLTLGRTQRFDPMVKGHDHFICEKCGRVYDAFANPKKILSSYLPHEGFTVTSHELSLYGTCRECAR